MCKHLLKIQRLILALLIFGGGIFYTSSATARVCFLPDSTDCGEGDVDVPEVQITCATYGGYETPEACLEARTNKTAQTCTLNSGCYYPKCAYDSERKCKNENPDKNCLSQTVDGVKCWYSQLKTCFDQGYKSACSSDENSTPVNIEAFDGPCYKCTEKATCKQMKPGVYYGPNDTCPKYTDRKDAGVTGKDGVCSTCEPQACTTINTAYKSEAKKDTCGSNKEAKKVEGTDSAADGPCYKCESKACNKINSSYINSSTSCNGTKTPVSGVVGSDGQCYKCVDNNNFDYIIYVDDQGDTGSSSDTNTTNWERYVYCTNNVHVDVISSGAMHDQRCRDFDQDCIDSYSSLSVQNGSTWREEFFQEQWGNESSFSQAEWTAQETIIEDSSYRMETTKQCQETKITHNGDIYKVVCGSPTCSDIAGYQTTPCSTGYKQIDYIQLPHEDCYKCENKKGWGIHYTHEVEDLDTRTYSCTITEDDGGVKADVSTRWKVSVYKKGTASEVEALDGKKYAYIDQHKGEVRYPKGEYNICFDYGRDVYIRPYYIHLATKDEDACDYSWDEDDGRWHPDYNNYDNINKGFCSDENIMTFGGITCMTATFEDNEEYYVQGDFEGNNIDGISEWECTPIATASH